MSTRRRFVVFYFILAAVLFIQASFAVPAEAAAASLSFSSTKRTLAMGGAFTASVVLNTGGVSINAASATVSFDPAKLAVTSVSRGGSIFTLWAEEPSYSNTKGFI